jgi:hypothetical protein
MNAPYFNNNNLAQGKGHTPVPFAYAYPPGYI